MFQGIPQGIGKNLRIGRVAQKRNIRVSGASRSIYLGEHLEYRCYPVTDRGSGQRVGFDQGGKWSGQTVTCSRCTRPSSPKPPSTADEATAQFARLDAAKERERQRRDMDRAAADTVSGKRPVPFHASR